MAVTVTVIASTFLPQPWTPLAAADDVKPLAVPRPANASSATAQGLSTQWLLWPADRSGGSARFIWSAGRLQLDAPRHKIGSRSSQTDTIQQHVTISAVGGIPSLMYRLTSEEQELQLEVNAATRVTIRHCRWEPADPRHYLSETTIVQPNRGPIETTVRRGDQTRTYQDATWLHLFLNHREDVPATVWDLVNRLPPQSLPQLVTEVDLSLRRALRQDLVRADGSDQVPYVSQADFDILLSELRSPQRSRRAAAHRKLLAAGTAVASHIQNHQGDLDAHQTAVLQSVWRAIHPPIEDHSGSLASRLYADREYWMAWQSGHSGAVPTAVATHLKRLDIGIQPSQRLAIAD